MTPSDSTNNPESLDVSRTFDAKGWQVLQSEGSAAAFHHTAPPGAPRSQIWIHRITKPALVLGSTQPDRLVDWEQAETDGIEVCRRRSGGGLVFINPQTDCWIDVIIPSGSSLWSPDVGAAFHWVGHVWAELLGAPGAVVSETSARSDLGAVWCFADLGHGEVSIDGLKVVGLSQRRTKTWARIQCLVVGSWDGRQLRPYVDLHWLAENWPIGRHPSPSPTAAALDPALVRAGPPGDFALRSPAELADDFIAAVPTAGQLSG